MKKWRRRILLVLLLIVATAAVFSGSGYWLAQSTPEWYQPLHLTEAERQALETRAETKFFQTQNWIDHAYKTESALRTARLSGSTLPTTVPIEPLTISFTEDELNATFQKWAGENKPRIEQYLRDPIVAIKGNRVVIGGTVPELNMIASIHFEPTIDAEGQLWMPMARIMGGRLPLPESVLGKYKERVINGLNSRLPGLQQEAEINAEGHANESARKAAAARFVLQILRHEPSDPVLFFPSVGGNMPLRITDLQVADRALSLTVEPMTASERADLLSRIRDEQPSARASTH